MALVSSEIAILCFGVLHVLLMVFVGVIASISVFKQSGHSIDSPFVIWIKSTWHLRKIYVDLIIHIFDFLTDLLVIRQWYMAEDEPGEDVPRVDATLMATVAVSVLIFYRLISSLAIYILAHRDIKLAFLQFLDLLLYVEIYKNYKAIYTNIDSSSYAIGSMEASNDTPDAECRTLSSDIVVGPEKPKKTIESSMRFKYIRSLEALFEASPQAVLQLIYVMRTGTIEVIFVVSVVQSIISMTLAMLDEDNVYMTHKRWDVYKQRMPPSLQFIKHALFRMCEITYRIALFSLVWTVVGGMPFSFILAVEASFPVIYVIYEYLDGLASWHEFFLALNIIITLPPEWIFEESQDFALMGEEDFIARIVFKIAEQIKGIAEFAVICIFVITPIFPFLCIIHLTRWLVFHPVGQTKFYIYSSFRILVSILEFLIILVYHYFGNDDDYLLHPNHALTVFIVCVVCMAIYVIFYPYLMPDIRLRDPKYHTNINIRSMSGYAFLGNTDELERLWNRKEKSILRMSEPSNSQQIEYNELSPLDRPLGCLYKGMRYKLVQTQKKIQTMEQAIERLNRSLGQIPRAILPSLLRDLCVISRERVKRSKSLKSLKNDKNDEKDQSQESEMSEMSEMTQMELIARGRALVAQDADTLVQVLGRIRKLEGAIDTHVTSDANDVKTGGSLADVEISDPGVMQVDLAQIARARGRSWSVVKARNDERVKLEQKLEKHVKMRRIEIQQLQQKSETLLDVFEAAMGVIEDVGVVKNIRGDLELIVLQVDPVQKGLKQVQEMQWILDRVKENIERDFEDAKGDVGKIDFSSESNNLTNIQETLIEMFNKRKASMPREADPIQLEKQVVAVVVPQLGAYDAVRALATQDLKDTKRALTELREVVLQLLQNKGPSHEMQRMDRMEWNGILERLQRVEQSLSHKEENYEKIVSGKIDLRQDTKHLLRVKEALLQQHDFVRQELKQRVKKIVDEMDAKVVRPLRRDEEMFEAYYKLLDAKQKIAKVRKEWKSMQEDQNKYQPTHFEMERIKKELAQFWQTSLYYADVNGHIEAARWLMKHGAVQKVPKVKGKERKALQNDMGSHGDEARMMQMIAQRSVQLVGVETTGNVQKINVAVKPGAAGAGGSSVRSIDMIRYESDLLVEER